MTTPEDVEYMREEAVWRTLSANSIKTTLRILGAIDIIVTIVLLFFLAFGFIPFLPPGALEYAFIYHFPHVAWGVLVLVASGSQSFELFGVVGLVGVVVVALDAWALIVLIVWFVGCVTGAPITFVTNCVLNFLTRFSVFAAAIALLIFSTVVFAKTLQMIKYVRDTRAANELARVQDRERKRF